MPGRTGIVKRNRIAKMKRDEDKKFAKRVAKKKAAKRRQAAVEAFKNRRTPGHDDFLISKPWPDDRWDGIMKKQTN